jgi:hypothetical protein
MVNFNEFAAFFDPRGHFNNRGGLKGTSTKSEPPISYLFTAKASDGASITGKPLGPNCPTDQNRSEELTRLLQLLNTPPRQS